MITAEIEDESGGDFYLQKIHKNLAYEVAICFKIRYNII